MTFEIRAADNSSASHVQSQIESAAFTTVYEGFLDQYHSNFNSTFYDATAVLENTQQVNQVAQLEVTLSGARVNSVSKDTNGDWVVDLNYQAEYNTVISPFISRHAMLQASNQGFQSSSHPCLNTFSPCCILDYIREYRTGNAFAAYVETAIGDCTDPAVLAQDTNVLFDLAHANSFTTGALSDVAGTSMTESVGHIVMTISKSAMQESIGRVSMAADGTETTNFFVGITFLTMLPTNAVATTATQINIELSSKDFIEFATVSSQAFTPVRYTQIALEQIKYLADPLDTEADYPQSAKLLIVLQNGVSADAASSLIPHDSIRWAISETLPDITDTSKWTNACSDQGNPPALHQLYDDALQQGCSNSQARARGICATTVTSDASGIGEIYIPLGDETITSAILASENMVLFVQFNVRTQDQFGKKAVSVMYVQAPLSAVSLLQNCESITVRDKLDEVTDMHLAVGIATNDTEFATNCQALDNIISGTGNGTAGFGGASGLINEAQSYADGLISLYITGDEDFFNPAGYELFIEDLWTVHTRSGMTNTITGYFTDSEAFTVATAFDGVHVEVSPHTTLTTNCGNDMYCAYRHDIRRHQVLNPYAVYEHGSIANPFDMEEAKQWLTTHVLGNSEFGNRLSNDFTNYTRGRKNVNDRFNKLYYINPTHKWVGAQVYPNPYDLLLVSDTVFMYGIVTFEDGTGVNRRRLLSVGPTGTSLTALPDAQLATKMANKEAAHKSYAYIRFRGMRQRILESIQAVVKSRRLLQKVTLTNRGIHGKLHSLAQKHRRVTRGRKPLQWDDENEEPFFDDEYNSDEEAQEGGENYVSQDEDSLDSPSRPSSIRRRARALLQAPAQQINGNGQSTLVSNRVINATTDLQLAVLSGAVNHSWQIYYISMEATANPSASESEVYTEIEARLQQHREWLFAYSDSVMIVKKPTPVVVTSPSQDWATSNPGQKLLDIQGMEIMVIWENAYGNADLLDHRLDVQSERLECAAWYGAYSPATYMRNAASENYSYCDVSGMVYSTTDNVGAVRVYDVERSTCGHLRVISTECTGIEPLYETPQAPVEGPGTTPQMEDPALRIELGLIIPLTAEMFMNISFSVRTVLANMSGVDVSRVTVKSIEELIDYEPESRRRLLQVYVAYVRVTFQILAPLGSTEEQIRAIVAGMTSERLSAGIAASDNAVLAALPPIKLWQEHTTTTTPEMVHTTTPKEETDSLPLILGIVAGVVVLGVGIVVYCWCKRSKGKAATNAQTDERQKLLPLQQSEMHASAQSDVPRNAVLNADNFLQRGRAGSVANRV